MLCIAGQVFYYLSPSIWRIIVLSKSVDILHLGLALYSIQSIIAVSNNRRSSKAWAKVFDNEVEVEFGFEARVEVVIGICLSFNAQAPTSA